MDKYSHNNFFILIGWLMEHLADRLWLADGVGHKMCDLLTYWLTDLEMAVNALVSFITKK